MNSFLENNLISLLTLGLSLGAVLIQVGFTKAEIRTQQAQFAEFKTETKEKFHEYDKKLAEVEAKNNSMSEKVNEKLDTLSHQMAVLLAWVEDEKRNAHNARSSS